MQRHAAASAQMKPVTSVRAALYARVSSDQQAERQTINSQVAALLARAAADGHKIAPELRFLDDGQSGASLVRPALERLRDLVAMVAIDVVYVHAPDRLARSYAHQAVLVEEFALLSMAEQAGTPPLLIVHDRNDRRLAWAESVALVDRWPDARLVTTEGLGHSRLLGDPAVHAEIVHFVSP